MTIYDIAREAGVSASTVSRVMNNKKGINAETRQRVEALLRKYNFEPNASARGLVNRSSETIGIMMSDIRTMHHAEGAYYIEQALQKVGYSCLIANCGFSEESRENGLKLFASRRVEAVVLIGSTLQTEQVRRDIQIYLPDHPVILENGCIELPNAYNVLADEEQGIADCTELLYAKGKKRPCFINLNKTPSNTLKIKGFLHVWQQHNTEPGHEPPVICLDAKPQIGEWENCYEATRDLFRSYPDIDSLIFSTDLMANAGIRALADMGIRVPEQVSVIGVDDSIYSLLSTPRITSLDNRLEELSIICAQSLEKLLHNEEVPHQIIVPTRIIEREST